MKTYEQPIPVLTGDPRNWDRLTVLREIQALRDRLSQLESAAGALLYECDTNSYFDPNLEGPENDAANRVRVLLGQEPQLQDVEDEN